jgi:hypothetical protein
MTVARAEFRLQMMSAVWQVSVLLSVILAILSALAGARTVDRQDREINLLATYRAVAADGGRHVVNGFEIDDALRAIRPIARTSVLLHPEQPTQYRDVGPEGLAEGILSPHQTTPADGINLDLEFILRSLMGLLAAIIGAASIVTARHKMLTKSLVALPVSPTALVIGALVGGLGAIGIGTSAVVAASLATLGVVDASKITAAVGVSAGFLWLSAVLLGAALQGAGAAIALWARTAAGVLSGTVAFWLITTVLAIPVVGALVPTVAHLPARALFETERRTLYNEMTTRIERAAGDIVQRELGQDLSTPRGPLDGPTRTAVEDLWTSELRVLRAALDDRETSLLGAHEAQRRWRQWLSVPLPGALFRSASLELTGVGSGAAARWDDGTRAYLRALNSAVFDARPRVHFRLQRVDGVSALFVHDRAPRPTIATLPTFTPSDATLREQVRDARAPMLLLAFHALLTWLLAIVVFVRRQAVIGNWR